MLEFELKVDTLLAQLAALLNGRGWKMATAESCTGGWVAKCCTDLAGSSTWFERGFVTYSNEAKQQMLGVSHDALETHGAVSEVVACQMAEGAQKNAGVEVAVSTTGIAGPDGGTPEKPVGLVHFGWCVAGEPVSCGAVVFEGERNAVRQQTVLHALQGIVSRLEALT
ncbi:MAG: nicotinamide-nucleotide amidohydrolase family protein [Xanthomonadales bacterium]|nr:nicotinamide-nucleotide amidohydrolase family protein [Xanthomonadales bacterium]